MSITVYADFSCPLSFLAHQRVARLEAQGLEEVDWRAVVAQPARSVTGRLLTPDMKAELGRVARQSATSAEELPTVPSRLCHAGAMTAAYAEAFSDDVAAPLRAAFLRAVWREGENLSDASTYGASSPRS